MNNAVNLLNNEGYFLYVNPKNNANENLNFTRYILRNNNESMIHEILLNEETNLENVVEMIETTKNERIIQQKNKRFFGKQNWW